MADASQAIHEHSCFRRHASAGSLPLGNAGILAGQWRSHLIRTLTSFRNSDRWQDQKMARKIQATLVEVPSHFMGKIDTQEKFDAHKREMAERVWATMRANNSRECRDCHSYETMSAELQGRQAQRRHSLEYREATGKTCIDCHKGIAHSLPE